MPTAITPVTTVIRYLIPVIAVAIVLEVVYILLRGRRKPAPMAYFELGDTGNRIDVLFYENAMGRSKVNDIILLDPSASRFHAVLSLRASGWVITDIGAKAGVVLNGKKIEQRAGLRTGDVLTLGSTRLIFRDRVPDGR